MNKGICRFAVGVICVGILSGCGDTLDVMATSNVLTEDEARRALSKLPYQYSFRQVAVPRGAEGAIAGRALNAHGVTLNFGVALGRLPNPVPIPRAGTSESYGYPDGGFIFTDDLQFRNVKGKLVTNPQLKTAKQFRDAVEISVQMTDKLCKAATGEPCPP